MNKLHVRWMIRRDVPEVLSLAPGVTENTILGYLRDRSMIGMVAETLEETESLTYPVVGWLVFSMRRKLLRIERLASSPEAKKAILAKMIDKVQGSSHRNRVHMRVRYNDFRLIALLKEAGFWGWPDTDDTIDFVYRKVDDNGELVTDNNDDDNDTGLVPV